MANDLKTRERIGNTVDIKIIERLRAYSKESGIPISKLLDRAILLLLETIEK